MSEYYGSKLYFYQGFINLPMQVLMLDIYGKIGEKRFESYLAMSALGLGSYLLSERLAKGLYSTIHKDKVHTPETGVRYYSDLRTKQFYDHTINKISREIPKKQDILQEHALEILKQAPAYSEGYTNMWWGALSALTAYKSLSAKKENIFYDIVYGLTQPICVVLKDEGILK